MAAINASNPTLSDVAARMDPNDKIATIIEMLKQTNDILTDMSWMEANDGTSHKTTVRSGLPTVAWRMLNYGVQPSKSRSVQISDTCGMLEGYSEIDKKLAMLNGNSAAFRLSEDMGFFQAMNHTMASKLIYGNIDADPEQIMGLAPRYSSLSAENAGNIIDAGGTGSDNTSMWMVTWGPNTVHGIYPKGSKAGLQHKDLGEVTLEDAAGGYYQGLRTHYSWDCGLTLRDWRAVVRVANIDTTELADAGETGFDGADLPNYLIKAYNKARRYMKLGRSVIYCNETVMTAIDLIASNRSNTWFTTSEGIDGMPIVKFRGIPFRMVDAILDTEEAVS
jgi:hypothetical protein